MSGTHDFRLHNRTDISDRQSENSLPSLREITPELSTDDVRPSVDDLIHIRDSWWTSLCQIADGDDYQAAFDAIDDTIRPALVWTLDLGRDVNRALPTMERMGNADQGPVAGRVAPGVAVLLDSLKELKLRDFSGISGCTEREGNVTAAHQGLADDFALLWSFYDPLRTMLTQQAIVQTGTSTVRLPVWDGHAPLGCIQAAGRSGRYVGEGDDLVIWVEK